ncbi:MAG: hypothetical protein WC784_06015 [Candidatus Shapirobacteria bacterium]|jgi:hypothetical protein
MTTQIEKVIVNQYGSEENFPGAEAFIFTNEAITAEELKKKFNIAIPGLAGILDTREATVLEGKRDEEGKRSKFLVDGLITEDNPDGTAKSYVSVELTKRETERENEIITRGSVFKDKQTVGLRVTRL